MSGLEIIRKPGIARGCSINTINSDLVMVFLKILKERLHGLSLYVRSLIGFIFFEILNKKGFKKFIICQKVTEMFICLYASLFSVNSVDIGLKTVNNPNIINIGSITIL